jgi:hypothetical protein
MFEITTMTEVTITSVTNRQETHGEEKVPAVTIGLELITANTFLDLIDPKLREAMYTAVEGQEDLPGIVQSTPVLRCNSIDKVVLPTAHEGWTLTVDEGVDESTPMVFGACKVDKFSVVPSQGSSVSLRFRVGTSDIDADRLGKLGMHNGQSIWVTITKPVIAPDAIDGSSEAFNRDHPAAEPNATDLFAGGHASDGDADDEARAPSDLEGRLESAMQDPAVRIETSRAGTRTARGRERTQAALADGSGSSE